MLFRQELRKAKKVIELRLRGGVSWLCLLDDEGIRIILCPFRSRDPAETDTSAPPDCEGAQRQFVRFQPCDLAQTALDAQGTLPTLYVPRIAAAFRYGWLAGWDVAIPLAPSDLLTREDCLSWVASIVHDSPDLAGLEGADLITIERASERFAGGELGWEPWVERNLLCAFALKAPVLAEA